jgi:hypothetical protein
MNGQIQVIQRADLVAAPEILVDLGQMLGMYCFVVGWAHDVQIPRPPARRDRLPLIEGNALRYKKLHSQKFQRRGPMGGLRVVRACRRRFSLGFS